VVQSLVVPACIVRNSRGFWVGNSLKPVRRSRRQEAEDSERERSRHQRCAAGETPGVMEAHFCVCAALVRMCGRDARAESDRTHTSAVDGVELREKICSMCVRVCARAHIYTYVHVHVLRASES